MLYTQGRGSRFGGDALGLVGLGCVMENMWLTAESLGLGMHVLTVFRDSHVESEARRILKIESHLKIAFACSLGYPVDRAAKVVRVRRELEAFVHHNAFGKKDVPWSLESKKGLSQEESLSTGNDVQKAYAE